MKAIPLLCLALVLTGCQSVTTTTQMRQSVQTGSIRLSLVQYFYFSIYENYRNKGIRLFKLPESATLEEFRQPVADELELPSDSTWEDILKHPDVACHLTDERRKELIRIFGLKADATWFDLQAYAEYLRRNNAKFGL